MHAYDKYFKQLEAFAIIGTSINDFSNRLNYAFNSVPEKSNIGEICTILMIKACIRCWNVQVYSFLSDDNDARACASTVSENIFSFSCHSLYLLLKKNGMAKSEAKEYIKSWKKIHGEQTVKIIISGNRSIGMNLNSFIDDIYISQYKVRRNGIPEKI